MYRVLVKASHTACAGPFGLRVALYCAEIQVAARLPLAAEQLLLVNFLTKQ
jgi:hypothetical protein